MYSACSSAEVGTVWKKLKGLEELVVVVLRALEHQVLEQVREAGLARDLVLGADVVPEVDRDDRRLAVGVHDHGQAVVEAEGLVGDGDGRGGAREAARGQHGEGERQEQGTQGHAGTPELGFWLG